MPDNIPQSILDISDNPELTDVKTSSNGKFIVENYYVGGDLCSNAMRVVHRAILTSLNNEVDRYIFDEELLVEEDGYDGCPEDKIFSRGLSWIAPMLIEAYERGFRDGQS